jgi:hypothetical protein
MKWRRGIEFKERKKNDPHTLDDETPLCIGEISSRCSLCYLRKFWEVTLLSVNICRTRNQKRTPVIPRIRNIFCLTTGFFVYLCCHLASRMSGFAKDPGVGWHIASGNWMLDNCAIPSIDPFLARAGPLPWISDQWGSDLILSLVFRGFGWVGLYNLLFLLYLSAFFLVVYPTVRKRTGSAFIALVVTIFTSKPAEIHFILRPVVVSFLFMALLGAMLSKASKSVDNGNIKPLFGSFLLFLAWANLHPSFAYGLVILVLYLGAAAAWDWFSARKAEGLLRSGSIAVAAILGTLCNPYGWRLHHSILALGSSKFFMRLHQEWMPLDVLESEGGFFVWFFAIMVVAGLVRASKGEKLDGAGFAELVILAFAARSGLAHMRMIPYFFILSAPLLGVSILSLADYIESRTSHLVPGLRERFKLREQSESERASLPMLMGFLFIICIGGTFFGRVAGFPTFNPDPKNSSGFDSSDTDRVLHIPLGPPVSLYPYQAIEYLNELADRWPLVKEGGTQRLAVLNPPEWGGFIALNGGSVVRPLFDDRNTLLGEERYLDYFRAARSCGSLMELAQRLGADFLMIKSSDLTMSGCGLNRPSDTSKMTKLEDKDGELRWADPILQLKPSFKDGVAAVFRVPSLSDVRSERLKAVAKPE